MVTRSSPEDWAHTEHLVPPTLANVVLLDLVLAGIAEGAIRTEADLRRLYAELRRTPATSADRNSARTSRRTSAPRPGRPAARVAGHRNKTDSAPA